MKRWPYFFWVFAINICFVVAAQGLQGTEEAAYIIIWPFGFGLWIYLTVLRCDDIGINRWWAAMVIFPLAPLYFIFAPKRQRLSAG